MLELKKVFLVAATTMACAVVAHPIDAWAQATAEAAVPAPGSAAPAQAPAPSPVPSPVESQAAPAEPPAVAHGVEPAAGVFGSTQWGGRGIHRLASGFATSKGALVLGGSAGLSRHGPLFFDGDRNTRATQSIDLAWAPVYGLELSGSYHMLVNNYTGLAKRNLQVQGNPTLRVKYGHAIARTVALGLQLGATMPTSAFGRGLTARATNLEATGLASWQPHSRIEVVGNVGYLWDRSNAIYPNDTADGLQRFAYQINRVSALPYGVGALGRITLGHRVDLLPFVEVSGAFGLGEGATLKNDPFRITGGAKVYPTKSRVLELSVGAEGALGGRTRSGSPFGGQPAWEVFAHLHAHLGQMLSVGEAPPAVPQAAEADPMAHVIGDPSHDMATFRLAGKVLDADSNRPIFGARVMVGEAEDVLLATDDQTGAFRSWPISAGPGLIRVTAKALGYQDEERILPRPQANEEVALVFLAKADAAKPRLAALKGVLHDARTGKPIAGGTVRIDAQGLQVLSDRAGKFALKGKPGRYTVLFSAPHYVVQERVLTLRPNETMLFNAELRPDDGL